MIPHENPNYGFINYFFQKNDQYVVKIMREKWAIPGGVFLALGLLAFFTASEIQVEVGILPFTFALITLLVSGMILIVVGVVSFIVNRL